VRRADLPDGKKREKIGEARGDAKNDEGMQVGRVSDNAQGGNNPEVDRSRSRKRQAESRACSRKRKKTLPKREAKATSGVRRPKDKKGQSGGCGERDVDASLCAEDGDDAEGQSQRSAESRGHPNRNTSPNIHQLGPIDEV
jgi:hypothetical protein